MPDGRVWFAQNLNYTKDLVFNMYAREANGQQFTSTENGVPAIGSYWCPGADGSTYSGDQNMCNIYGALYTWETAMMVDGKYSDETKTSSAWDESWVSPYYFNASTAPSSSNNANKNNARAGRGICPRGWHIPTDFEWANMLDAIEGNTTYTSQIGYSTWGSVAGKMLKSSATYSGADPGNGFWQQGAAHGDDELGFKAIPSGFLYTGREGFASRGAQAAWLVSNTTAVHFPSRLVQAGHAWVARFTYARNFGVTARCICDI
jgi:uncharacterized protein (TIGR02145 family)